MDLAILFIILFVTLAIRVPIAFALAISSLAFFWITGAPINIIPQRFFSGLNNFTLLALPLFISLGYLMEESGISNRLINFCCAIVGHIKGGLGLVNVLASMFFAGMSGSAVADTAAIGSIIIPGMIKRGYPRDFSAAVTASSASIGIIIPPSIPMIFFSLVSGTSVAALFAAGYIPGLLVGILQMSVVYHFAKKYNYPIENKFSWRNFLVTLKASVLPLLIPIIILAGIVFGVVTPTEAGLLAFIVALLASFLYRTITLRGLYRILVSAGLSCSLVSIIIAGSSLFSWVLTRQRIPQMITANIMAFSDNNIVILLLISIMLIMLGTIFHAIPMILIMAPMLMPIITKLNISPVHFGMIFILAVAIGQQTPPTASALYITSTIAKIDILSIVRANVWFVLCIAFILYLVLFFPVVVLYIPRILGFI